jgi:hypothetical protein
LDAEAEQVGQAADVAAGGVGLVEDAVFADGGDRQVGADGQPDPAFAAFLRAATGVFGQERVPLGGLGPAGSARSEVCR